MAVYDALELRMLDQVQHEYVRAHDGVPIEQELDRFISKTHGYKKGWVEVDGDKYVRYDRVASVSISRDLDDEQGPLAAV